MNMTYQMGIEGLLEFRDTLSRVQAGDFAGAAAAMLVSDWATESKARAYRLSKTDGTGGMAMNAKHTQLASRADCCFVGGAAGALDSGLALMIIAPRQVQSGRRPHANSRHCARDRLTNRSQGGVCVPETIAASSEPTTVKENH